MFEHEYQIQMYTQLGVRKGTMQLQMNHGQINGTMTILKQTEPLQGTMDENGVCHLSGRLVTLLNTIPFTAEGRITDKELELTLTGGTNRFRITGIVLQQRRGEKSCQENK